MGKILWGMLLCLGSLGTTAWGQPQIIIKFSHVVAPDTPKGKAAEYFKWRAETLTRGRVRVDVYPNSQLYKDKEELEALQLGAVQMLAPSLAKFGPLGIREFEVFDLPYIFDNYDMLHRITQGPVGRELLDKLDAKGIKGLAFWDNGFKSFSANTPIHLPGDLKGKRLRIQSSKVLDEEIRALGGRPQVMPFSEVYPALKAGVIDGTENPVSNFYTQKMYLVQPYLSLTDHGYLGYAVIVNKRFWDELPADVRSALEQAVRDSTLYANRIAKEENDRALEAVRRSGKTHIYQPNARERAAFKQALIPVHARMAARIGPDLIRAIYRETGFKAN